MIRGSPPAGIRVAVEGPPPWPAKLQQMLSGRFEVRPLSALEEDERADVAILVHERREEDPPRELIDLAAVPLIVLLDDPQPQWVSSALRAGVRAVLSSDVHQAELGAAVEAVAAGLLVVHPHDVQPLFSPALAPLPAGRFFEPLTPREIEVLRLLASGSANKEIAARLQISEHTVKFHVASVLGKLGAGTRTEAVTIGLRHGLILL